MRDEEYRKLRQALEEQRDADLELIRAGYRAKLHALDMLRERPPASDESVLLASHETQPKAETHKPAEMQSPAAPKAAGVGAGSSWARLVRGFAPAARS